MLRLIQNNYNIKMF